MEVCSLALDYKTRTRTKRDLSDAKFYDIELGDLKSIVLAFGGKLPKRSTKSGLAKTILSLVSEKCPDECLKLA